MIIGHPRRNNKVEIHETLRLNGSDIKRVKNFGQSEFKKLTSV